MAGQQILDLSGEGSTPSSPANSPMDSEGINSSI